MGGFGFGYEGLFGSLMSEEVVWLVLRVHVCGIVRVSEGQWSCLLLAMVCPGALGVHCLQRYPVFLTNCTL